MIHDYQKNPNSIPMIRASLSKASKDSVLLQEILSYIGESLDADTILDTQLSPLGKVLNVSQLHQVLRARVTDLRKNIEGIQHELDGLREMTDVISETTMFRLQESMQANTKSLANVFESSERSSSSLEILQIVLSGTLAFEILDRLTGEWSVMDTEWGKEYIHDLLIEKPGVWFIINLSLWGVIAWILKSIMAHLAAKSSGVVTVRFKPNMEINVMELRSYLGHKDVGEEEIGIENNQRIKKVSWVDEDLIIGKESKIEISWDEEYGYLLSCCLQVNKGKDGVNDNTLKELFLEEFKKHNILKIHQNEEKKREEHNKED